MPVDDRERAVIDLWRKGHLSSGTIQIYLQWVRRFRAFGEKRQLDDVEQLTGRALVSSFFATPDPGSGSESARRIAADLRTTLCTRGLAHCARSAWRCRRGESRMSPHLCLHCLGNSASSARHIAACRMGLCDAISTQQPHSWHCFEVGGVPFIEPA